MPISLFIAPAAHGKTRYLVNRVREATQNLQACPRICVANRQQLSVWRHRLAAEGGCLGAHLMTFDDLYRRCLVEAGAAYTQIGDILEYRILRTVIGSVAPSYYGRVKELPGFIQECQRIISELKASQIRPDVFLESLHQIGDPPRLREIGQIFAGYQQYLQQHRLADYPGLGWLAVEALSGPAHDVGRDWPVLIFDGFASFTQVQLSLMDLLRSRVSELVITLSGDHDNNAPRPCHRHYMRTRRAVEEALQVSARPLPELAPPPAPFARLEQRLFSNASAESPDAAVEAPAPAVEMATVSDQAAEVVLALRWLKQKIVEEKIAPGDVSLVARHIAPYRSQILLVAEEFGLPVYFVEGLSLQANPCVAALLSLLQLMLPAGDNGDGSPALPRRQLLTTLRSPYFTWAQLTSNSGKDGAPALTAEDVEQLDNVARWGQVIGGVQQWREALERLAKIAWDGSAARDDNGYAAPSQMPTGRQALALQDKFERLLQALAPPQGRQPIVHFIAWTERLVGAEPDGPTTFQGGTLAILEAIHHGPPDVARRDIAALRRLKDVLGGLYWAHEMQLVDNTIDYAQFYEELRGAVEAVTYDVSPQLPRDAILVSDVHQVRGVPCRAQAVIGLGEGIFPAPLREEPFLRERDRDALRHKCGLLLDSAIDSHEQEYFYETVTRTRDWLLLTRPALAESGAPWEPSPFWEEIARITAASSTSQQRNSGQLAPASQTELLFRLAATTKEPAESLAQQTALVERWRHLQQSAAVFVARWSSAESGYNGSLSMMARAIKARFDGDHVWSPSRLENYLSCPHHFFFANVLGVEARPQPMEELDARQLGNIYHRLMEETYRRLQPEQRLDPEYLLQALHEVAGPLLAAAPQQEGFREPVWWFEMQQEILADAETSLLALAALDGGFVPIAFELRFGLGAGAPLVLERDGQRVRLRGVIDRVDRNAQGKLRVIDYKTAAPYSYSPSAHRDGKRLQLPLYALAAERTLGLGPVVDGFYWHMRHAQASDFRLHGADLDEAAETATAHIWRALDGVHSGHFAPSPPSDGCPSYCPATAFCWHYKPNRFS